MEHWYPSQPKLGRGRLPYPVKDVSSSCEHNFVETSPGFSAKEKKFSGQRNYQAIGNGKTQLTKPTNVFSIPFQVVKHRSQLIYTRVTKDEDEEEKEEKETKEEKGGKKGKK